MESLQKLREPVAVVLLVTVGLRVVLALVSAGVYAGDDVLATFALAAGALASWVSDPALILALAAVLLACGLGKRTPHARTLTLVGVITVGASLLVNLVFLLTGLTAGGPTRVVDTLTGLLLLVVPVLTGIVLLRLLATLPAADPAAAPYAITPGGTDPAYGPGQPDPNTSYQPIPQDPAAQYQPTWQTDTAAGAAWHTAGDAASGAPAAGWGTPGQSGGWVPDPAVPAPTTPTGAGEPRPPAPPPWPTTRT